MDKIIKLNDEIELDIVDLGDVGEGIGKYENFAVFVEDTVPGDKVLVKITKAKKSFAKGQVIKLIKESELRQEAPCKYFEECGGCQIQNIKYENQLKLKENKVANIIKRIGGFTGVEINPIIGMENSFRYRNKGAFVVSKVNGKVVIGLYKKKSHEVIPVDDCLIQDEKVKDILEGVKKHIIKFDVKVYNRKNNSGLVRNVVVRKSEATGEYMVIIVTNGSKLPMSKVLAKTLVEENNKIVSVYQNINKKHSSEILGEDSKLLFGQEKIIDEIDGLKFEISPLSFYQVNSVQTEKLYKKALEYCNLSSEELVIDLYSGIGTISLLLAREAKEVIGIESVKPAVVDARQNAKINNIENVRFMRAKAEDKLPELVKDGFKPEVIVLDPPRVGCDKKVLDAILEVKPEKIVYVSCKPSTLARDLKILCESGEYTLEGVTPVDMFGHSAHVETVVKLQR
jgi:23S rRNA (uracil1939-C5)-methyltransferase